MNRLSLAPLLIGVCTGSITCQTASRPAPSPATAPPQVTSSQTTEVNTQSLAKLDSPWGMTFLPDGRLLITEKPGRLRVFANNQLSEPIGGVPAVVYRGQGGLMDVAIDPQFATNSLVYIYFVEAAPEQPQGATDPGDPRFGSAGPNRDNVLKGGAVARGRLVGNQLQDVKIIWRQVPKTIGRGHFGGRLVFASDGKLIITSGERMRFDPAQDMTSNLGKIVRINSDGSIPSDNPPVAGKDARPDILTSGHRNPLGVIVHPVTKEIWINEMGPKGGDEINIIVPGKNYGWPIVSNGSNYDDSPIPDHPTRPEFQPPITSWNPVISPSGMIYYTGSMFPSWKGNLLLGGLSSESVIRLTLDGNKVTGEERMKMGKRIRDVEQAPDGAVLFTPTASVLVRPIG